MAMKDKDWNTGLEEKRQDNDAHHVIQDLLWGKEQHQDKRQNPQRVLRL